eukprot:SAG31_NODE_357_length_17115_cov_64.211801_8_plen_389_part_00
MVLLSQTRALCRLLVNTFRVEKYQEAKLRELQAATIARTPAIMKLFRTVRAAATSIDVVRTAVCAAEKSITEETDRQLHELNCAERAALEHLREKHTIESHKMRRTRHLRRTDEVDAEMKAQLAAQQVEGNVVRAEYATKRQVITAKNREKYTGRDIFSEQDRTWLARCMEILIEPMDFGVAVSVGGATGSTRPRSKGYCDAVTAFTSGDEHGRQNGDVLPSCSRTTTNTGGMVVDQHAAAALYDNEVQNEKEQEQQVQVVEPPSAPVLPALGRPRVEVSFSAELLTMQSTTAMRKTELVDADTGGGRKATEEQPIPWYNISEFEMDDLPCALIFDNCSDPEERDTPRLLSVRLSTNHTPVRKYMALYSDIHLCLSIVWSFPGGAYSM